MSDHSSPQNGDYSSIPDGVHASVPYDQMVEPARKLRDTYARKPGIPLFKREFGYYLRKDAAYRLVMSVMGDRAAEIMMSKYKDGQKVNLSSTLPEKNAAYRALVEAVSLLAQARTNFQRNLSALE